ncbi:MAG: undecaprenyldiphospho-muramoylpentapeptide beta-N-acetylglucosaminyltransferase [Candidatus Amoebophilus sp. 36-38]|nr:MAG: undecaprenyldiphospho-muramoylpentapeptide beta-N-acetylglucosaminyltransferase [Candidatus Amoebophilus sp. 36-38]
MRVIISGGGTGGHIYPGIAIADALKKQSAEHEILFVGAQGKMEMDYVPAAGYRIIGLPIRGIRRRFKEMLKNIVVPFRVLASLWKARSIIKAVSPDVVIGTGGYASFPMVYMAASMHIPVVLQEQNAYPGIVNKLLAKYANKICVAYEHMDKYFPTNKIVLTGNPVREFLMKEEASHEASCQFFGLSPDAPIVLILGGSQGAGMITKCILDAIHLFAENGIQVLLSTGKAYFEKIDSHLFKENPLHFRVLPYIERMDLALAAASIVVSRAGAIAIAEIGVAQKPAIFIPSPHVAADHQMKNILPLVDKEAAMLVKDQEVSEKLIPTILSLVNDTKRQETLIKNLTQYVKPNAAAAIVNTIENLV